ncbi:hypothetical protein [Halovivax gelatinilyticus]|uniref:hypothetical protein n=1 Tax=Halovivax gelatinilyticus TaxID=2961597 RepID=UPI0020CA3C4D|nr:hypothetical protein [Halovivax gelatinilyticus]
MNVVMPYNVLVDQLTEANDHFMDVAAGDLLAPVLLAAGTLLIAFSVAVMGYLLAGSAVDLVTRS